MPTDPKAFAAVAHRLGGVNPNDDEGVTGFYQRLASRAYTSAQRDLVFGFLLASETEPTGADLERLADMMAQAKLQDRAKVLTLAVKPANKRKRRIAASATEMEAKTASELDHAPLE